MKKILFAIAIVITIGLAANAQSDGFFRNWDNGINERSGSDPSIGLPNGQDLVSGTTYGNDQSTPLGSGLLVLTALGAGYAVARNRRK